MNNYSESISAAMQCCLNAAIYPHMPIGKVWIYRLLFVILCVRVCVFVRLRISPPSIKLVASNFAWLFIGVQCME